MLERLLAIGVMVWLLMGVIRTRQYEAVRGITHHQGNLGGEQAAHRMADEYNICSRRLMRFKPGTEFISRHLNGFIRLIPGIYLGVNSVRLGQKLAQVRVNMGRK